MKISVYTTQKDFICESEVKEKNGDLVTFYTDEVNHLRMKGKVIIVFYDSIYGKLIYKSRYITFERVYTEKGIQVALTFKLEELIKTEQRRNDVKVKTKFKAIIELVDDNWNLIKYDNSQPKIFNVLIKDISASGILFITSKNLSLNQKFIFDFDTNRELMRIKAEIIRFQKYDDTYNGYGCKFIELSESEEAMLRKIVFNLQIRSKNKGL